MYILLWPALLQVTGLLVLAAQLAVMAWAAFITLIKHPTKRRPLEGKAK